MITAPPAQTLVRSATQLAAAGCCFLPTLYTSHYNTNPLSPTVAETQTPRLPKPKPLINNRLPKPKPRLLVSLAVQCSVIACSIIGASRSKPHTSDVMSIEIVYHSVYTCSLFQRYAIFHSIMRMRAQRREHEPSARDRERENTSTQRKSKLTEQLLQRKKD